VKQHDRRTQHANGQQRVRRTRLYLERREVRITWIGRPAGRPWPERSAATVTDESGQALTQATPRAAQPLAGRAEAGEVHPSGTAAAGPKRISFLSLFGLR
jgi:hypothetical protein